MGLSLLFRMRWRIFVNAVRSLRGQSSLKVVVILFSTAALWGGLFMLFLDGFHFLSSDALMDFRALVIGVMFAVFFLSLFVMLVFSNGIIAYGSLFRSEETAFLLARPFKPAHIFVFKLSDALLFSSWAFIFLALPIIVALGVAEHSPWYYYPMAGLFFAVFALLPAAVGGLMTLLVARFLAHSPRRVLLLLAVAAAIPAAAWGLGLARELHVGMRMGEAWMQNVLGRLQASESPLLPSFWVSDGIRSLSQGRLSDALYRFGLLLSSALFVGMLAVQGARRWYVAAYHRNQALPRKRKGRVSRELYRLLESCLPGIRRETRILIIKDVKNFLRDPVQWSQVLIFFGLLGVYFINIRKLRYDLGAAFWQNLISLLNLVATSLTLSTFTSRFIFPQLSLEGRKFWILGLLPIKRRDILFSKFWFAFAGSFVLSESLMLLSDSMIGVARPVRVLHAVTVLLISGGLSALAVGVGALYPNLREENPSKIVSGFGGTLNLVLSILLVALMVGLLAAPYHLLQMLPGQNLELLEKLFEPARWLALVIAGLAIALPLILGLRAFERMET